MMIAVLTIIAFVVGAVVGAIAYRSWHRARERRRERELLDRWTKVYGLTQPLLGESNDEVRTRITNFLGSWR